MWTNDGNPEERARPPSPSAQLLLLLLLLLSAPEKLHCTSCTFKMSPLHFLSPRPAHVFSSRLRGAFLEAPNLRRRDPSHVLQLLLRGTRRRRPAFLVSSMWPLRTIASCDSSFLQASAQRDSLEMKNARRAPSPSAPSVRHRGGGINKNKRSFVQTGSSIRALVPENSLCSVLTPPLLPPRALLL